MTFRSDNQTVPPDVDALLQDIGFDLRQVTWGYQELFRSILDRLLRTGRLDPSNREIVAAFAEVLRQSDKSTFDSVVKSFLEAVDGPFGWLMRLPRLFERWSRTGLRLARFRHFLGMRFFEASGRGQLGRTPAEVEFVLDMVNLLHEKEPELTAPFIQGWPILRQHLGLEDIRTFVFDVQRLFHRNPATARAFLTCELASARHRIEQLSRQARLGMLHDALQRILTALTGRPLELDNLGRLDADELQERGSVFIACAAGVYLPEVIREFPSREQNAACFKALVCLAAAALEARSLAEVHGSPGVERVTDLFPEAAGPARTALAGLLYVVEAVRVQEYVRRRFPGIREWVQTLVRFEFDVEPPRTVPDRILARALGIACDPGAAAHGMPELAREIAAISGSWREARDRILRLSGETRARVIGCFSIPPRPVCFFPDPFFPLTISSPSADRMMVDLHEARPLPPEDQQNDAVLTDTGRPEPDDAQAPASGDDDASRSADENRDATPGKVGYFYDEWNVHCGDYYHNWCCVHELRHRGKRRVLTLPPAVHAYADRVRRVFELLKPEDIRREERLLEGDDIHLDHFVEYVSQGERKEDTQMRFYTKPLTRRRDVAVAILLDLSGSTADAVHPPDAGKRRGQPLTTGPDGGRGFRAETGGRSEEKTVLDIEKEAAFILASGLQTLGDSFALFGFTGTGRENCRFYVFKDFQDPWNRDAVRELLSAAPGSSTRIGAALRHAGWKLSAVPAKTRLLLLITDGKPCDQGYETETHYAHHDVRKAVQENAALGIHTFCVSTSENTPADMELMFPNGRYLLLEDISRLPDVLSRVYLRLTR